MVPIQSEAEYEQALRIIESLFDAQPGTPEGDRLDALVTFVEAYEQEHHPITPANPTEALSYWMESRGIAKLESGQARHVD